MTPESRRSRQTAEQVTAGDIQVGDLIYFPNSRKPQEVGQVVNEEIHGGVVVRLWTSDGSVQWTCGPDASVARVPAAMEES